MLTMDKIYDASEVLKEVLNPTEVMRVQKLSDFYDVYVKPECLQVTGSFKVRGAYYKISRLSDEEKKRGVIACSAGNHAQGVALAAQKNNIKALICLPDGAPISKVEATKSYGAEICLVPGVYDDAYTKAIKLRDEKGYTFIHPFDDEDIIAGQGTVGLEIIRELPDADAVFVPVGGGGLISGVAFAVKSMNPKIKVYGVQSEGAPSMYNSVKDGKIETLPSVSTIADGIAVKSPGKITFEMCKKYVDGIVTVSDDEVSAAILALMESRKLVAEGAGAVSLAAAMFRKVPSLDGKKVCCVISGGNIDVNVLSRVISRGLLMSGRICTLTVEVPDRPGQLGEVASLIAKCGGNVTSVHHERTSEAAAVNGCLVRISMETRNFGHIDEIKRTLVQNGLKLVREIQ